MIISSTGWQRYLTSFSTAQGLAILLRLDNYGTKRGQGGVALFWGKHMGRVAHMSNLVHDRLCGIRLETSNGSIFNIISIYLPAQGSPESYSSCLDDLGEVIETRDMGSYTIICGDANADFSRKGRDGAVICVNKQGKTLLKFLDKYQLVPVKCILNAGNHVPMYEGPTGSSVIDYIFIPKAIKGLVSESKVLENDILNCSDHNPVSSIIDIGAVTNNVVADNPIRNKKWSEEERIDKYTHPLSIKLQEVEKNLISSDGCCEDIENAIMMVIENVREISKNVPTTRF